MRLFDESIPAMALIIGPHHCCIPVYRTTLLAAGILIQYTSPIFADSTTFSAGPILTAANERLVYILDVGGAASDISNFQIAGMESRSRCEAPLLWAVA
jgi:hypothetical protein